MSEKKAAELKYHERLNISVLSISQIKNYLESDILDTIGAWKEGFDVEKQCYHIIGPAGVGKTQVCYQIADSLTMKMFGEYNAKHPNNQKKFDIIMIKSPVLSRDDFTVPFPVRETKTNANGKTEEVMHKFRMLYSDFVPTDPDSFGLFVIDEFSRGDHQLQQLLWQVQNEYAVHRHPFPKGWFVVSIDNPDDQEYSMENLEDAAGLRRQLHIYTEVSAKDFLDYGISKNFHPWVIEYIQTHVERLYDFDSQKVGAVYANPASWEKVSNILRKMELRRGPIDFNELDAKLSGLLNTNMTRLFIAFAKEQKDISPKDVFMNLTKVKKDIKKLLDAKDNARLAELVASFCTYLTTSMPEYKTKQLNNVRDFLLMMPIDTAATFINHISSLDKSSSAFKYIGDMHATLLKTSKEYKKDFFDAITAAGAADF